ncbi:MAG TPA: ABC-2 family transporter protein [Roseiflexaceae bacterium]|nr:ABC-2 family transporter protein [Roseiflexaceae bacterium]
MRLYWEIARRSFQRATTYRTAYIAGLLTNAFFGALISFVYIAVYQGRGEVAGFSVRDAVSYVWMTQALISIGAAWIAPDLERTIRSGDVVTDLSRPWSFYGYWVSQALGERLFNLLIRGSLTYLIGVLYFRAFVPDVATLVAALPALLLATLLAFAYGFLINLAAFWMFDTTGLMLLANFMMSFFSGFLLPLAFFPEPLATIANYLPFRAITSVAAQAFLGQLSGGALIEAYLLQIFWAIVLIGAGQLLLRAAMRRVVIQGG